MSIVLKIISGPIRKSFKSELDAFIESNGHSIRPCMRFVLSSYVDLSRAGANKRRGRDLPTSSGLQFHSFVRSSFRSRSLQPSTCPQWSTRRPSITTSPWRRPWRPRRRRGPRPRQTPRSCGWKKWATLTLLTCVVIELLTPEESTRV